jgi:plastocyanin
VSATSSPNPDTADANTTVTATVNNTAPTAASGVILHATLPLNAIYVSAAPAQGTCSLSGRTLTCALGTVAAAAKTTVAIQLEPIQPSTVTTWFSASESGSTYTGLGRATVGVRGAAGSTYVSVADSGLAPSKLSFKAGTSVQFNFLGSSAHSVVDSIDGCDTGSQVGVSYAVCPYPAAGKFTAAEDGGTTHTASIAVANLVSPATVAHGNPVTVTGDTAAVPAGWGIDYQVQAPGGSWTTFARGASAGAVSYTPSLAGTYYFRSRLRNLTTGTASGFAPTTALAAS